MSTVYVRHIHNISQRPEEDTTGPLKLDCSTDDLDAVWRWLKRQRLDMAKKRGAEHRCQDGGAVFFLSGPYHSILVMPVGSALFDKHAPPSAKAAHPAPTVS